ncbi:hypothetical protein [Umezawaea sp. Da 62-37]|uniref:hypothetical protein n=1 Tax=Umezawaea sp. Da 62-37 TaxID=3075927 RepID=UPI0028F6FDFD|nr:hypothetical protein [Umezawaea sp. Da 62-37]WNV89321.1 hypothetical protein RM788_13750 [Umezawaea sp. Da 62-37]
MTTTLVFFFTAWLVSRSGDVRGAVPTGLLTAVLALTSGRVPGLDVRFTRPKDTGALEVPGLL